MVAGALARRACAGLICVGALAAAAGPAHAVQHPGVGLRPALADTEGLPIGAQARLARRAHARFVELTLPWRQVEGTCNVGVKCDDSNYAWGKFDRRFQAYLDRGIEVKSLRITNAPDWAIVGAGGCPPSERRVSMCPPSPEHYGALRSFARDAAHHYGPTFSRFDVKRFALWNEPNLANNWGGSPSTFRNAHQYSDLLEFFHDGIASPRGDPAVQIDAGEIAAGSASSLAGGSDEPRVWAHYFASYTDRKQRSLDYDQLTIHPYSEDPTQIPTKIFNYGILPGVDGRVSVTEFGWAEGTPSVENTDQQWKCATPQEQADKFTATVQDVRAMDESEATVQQLIWFSAVDNQPDAQRHAPKCLDDTGRYHTVDPTCQLDPAPDGEVRCVTNTFGLYMVAPDGSLDSPHDACARPVELAFIAAVSPGSTSGTPAC